MTSDAEIVTLAFRKCRVDRHTKERSFCLRQHGTCRSFVCGLSARSADKPHTLKCKVPRCRRLTTPTAWILDVLCNLRYGQWLD